MKSSLPAPQKVILEEEVYEEALEEIIHRDFFPDLPKLRVHAELLEAVESGDPERVREARLKQVSLKKKFSKGAGSETPFSQGFATPSIAGGTPFRGDPSATPLSVASRADTHASGQSSADQLVNTTLGLDHFLSQYISEDSSSFNELVNKAHKKHQDRISAWVTPDPNTLLIAGAPKSEQPLLITNGEKSGEKAALAGALIPVADSEKKELTANLDTWKYTSRNTLFFDGQGAPLTMKDIASLAPPPEIGCSNTRFRGGKPPVDDRVPHQENKPDILFDMLGNPDTKILAQIREAKDKKYDLEDLIGGPKVNGYGFMTTPSITPGVDASPLMTWGDVQGTPLLIDAPDTPLDFSSGPQFKLPDRSSREKKAMELTEKASRRLRGQKMMTPKIESVRHDPIASPALSIASSQQKTADGFVIPQSRPSRLSMMSPAAQQLAKRALSQKRLTTDTQLRASYSSPVVRSARTPTSSSALGSKTTPRITPRRDNQPASTPTGLPSGSKQQSSVTDNLMNL